MWDYSGFCAWLKALGFGLVKGACYKEITIESTWVLNNEESQFQK
jgi:hypothetical protein